jgi:histidine phosphotransferase ChpT
MDDKDALRLAALVCSRLTHDLAGPVGAIANGLELALDRAAGDAADLTREASNQLKTRLDFFRRAYGTGDGLTWGEARRISEAYLAGSRYRLNWADVPDENPPIARLLLNMILCAMETTPTGAALHVEPAPVPTVWAEGKIADLSIPSGEDLYRELSPRQVQPVFTAHLAWAMGLDLDAEALAAHRIVWRARPIEQG